MSEFLSKITEGHRNISNERRIAAGMGTALLTVGIAALALLGGKEAAEFVFGAMSITSPLLYYGLAHLLKPNNDDTFEFDYDALPLDEEKAKKLSQSLFGTEKFHELIINLNNDNGDGLRKKETIEKLLKAKKYETDDYGVEAMTHRQLLSALESFELKKNEANDRYASKITALRTAMRTRNFQLLPKALGDFIKAKQELDKFDPVHLNFRTYQGDAEGLIRGAVELIVAEVRTIANSDLNELDLKKAKEIILIYSRVRTIAKRGHDSRFNLLDEITAKELLEKPNIVQIVSTEDIDAGDNQFMDSPQPVPSSLISTSTKKKSPSIYARMNAELRKLREKNSEKIIAALDRKADKHSKFAPLAKLVREHEQKDAVFYAWIKARKEELGAKKKETKESQATSTSQSTTTLSKQEKEEIIKEISHELIEAFNNARTFGQMAHKAGGSITGKGIEADLREAASGRLTIEIGIGEKDMVYRIKLAQLQSVASGKLEPKQLIALTS